MLPVRSGLCQDGCTRPTVFKGTCIVTDEKAHDFNARDVASTHGCGQDRYAMPAVFKRICIVTGEMAQDVNAREVPSRSGPWPGLVHDTRSFQGHLHRDG